MKKKTSIFFIFFIFIVLMPNYYRIIYIFTNYSHNYKFSYKKEGVTKCYTIHAQLFLSD
jgi:hypothetical protein